MHGTITATDIETRFSSPEGQTMFPVFCNAVIVAAGPAVHSLPSLFLSSLAPMAERMESGR
jgi:hypothetical protein